MNDGERRSKIEFPAQGMRAVSVPTESLEVRLGDGIIRSKDGNWSAELSAELDSKFEKARSMFIYTNVDAVLEDIWDEERAVQAGWIPLQGIPEVEQFTIDLDRLNKDLEPDEAQLEIVCFNTSSLQEIPNEKAVRMAKDNEVTVDSTSWQTVFLQPGFPFEREAIRFKNTGDNELEYRVVSHNAGIESPEPLDNSGNRVKALGAGNRTEFYISSVSDYVELQARESTSGNSSTVKGSFAGGSN